LIQYVYGAMNRVLTLLIYDDIIPKTSASRQLKNFSLSVFSLLFWFFWFFALVMRVLVARYFVLGGGVRDV
jgi:hypothetical protein